MVIAFYVVAYFAGGIIMSGVIDALGGLEDDDVLAVAILFLWPLVILLMLGYGLFVVARDITKHILKDG
jgi:hypothetical protein